MKIVTAAAIASLMLAAFLALRSDADQIPLRSRSILRPAPHRTWYSRQGNEMRASKLIGTTVQNDADESIGKINEVVLGKDGKVAAVVVGVGGFLGWASAKWQ